MTEDSINSLFEFSDSIAQLKDMAIRELLAMASECDKLRSKPENEPLYQLNLLDIVPTEEPHTSQFLSAILNYRKKGKYVVLESFIETFLSPAGLDKNRVSNPAITAEKTSRIDVLILDNDFAIIIENKLKNAPFQQNQLGRYIETIHRRGYDYDKIYMVILPQYFNPNLINDLRPSVWRCPPDGLSAPNGERRCTHIDQYRCWCDDSGRSLSPTEEVHCAECRRKDFRTMFRNRTVIIQSKLSEWLLTLETIIEPRQTILLSAIHQFADFTKGLFDTRINHHLIMDIQKIIKENFLPDSASALTQWEILNEKSQELGKIQSAMSAMKLQLSKDLIDEWYHELKPEFEGLRREVQKSFGLIINDVWVGCWCGSHNNDQPYWGFYCDDKGSPEQQAMVREILAECDTPSAKSDGNYISWNSTLNGADECRRFYNAAKHLGYL